MIPSEDGPNASSNTSKGTEAAYRSGPKKIISSEFLLTFSELF